MVELLVLTCIGMSVLLRKALVKYALLCHILVRIQNECIVTRLALTDRSRLAWMLFGRGVS